MISNRVYALALGLYPRAFRERFGAEMRYIFAEERARGVSSTGLLVDALFCAVRQQLARPFSPLDAQARAAAGYVEMSGSSIPPVRVVQALVLMLAAGAMLGSVCAAGHGDIGPRVMRPYSTSVRYAGSGRTWLITPAPFTTHTRREARPQ